MIRLLRRAGLGVLLFAGSTTAADAAEAFTFDWPAPGQAAVTVDMLKRERAARFRYDLISEPVADSGAILVHSRDFEPLVFDGRPVDTPEARAAVAPAMAVAAAVPSLRIAPDGTFAGFEGDFDAVFERLAEVYGEDPQAADAMQTLRDTPQLRDAAAMKVVDTWETWVGNWVGLGLEEGQSKTETVEIAAFGGTAEQETTIRHAGPSDACDGCVTIHWEGTLDSPEFRRGWEAMMRTLASQVGNTEGLESFLSSVESIKRIAEIRLETDPATLMPYVVARENTIVLQVGDGPPARQIERTTYRFDWSDRPDAAPPE